MSMMTARPPAATTMSVVAPPRPEAPPVTSTVRPSRRIGRLYVGADVRFRRMILGRRPFLCGGLALLAAACGSTGTGTRRLSIATGGTGGVFYPYGGGIAKGLTEHLPNTEVTAEGTAASVDNLKFIKQGTSDLAFSMADIAADAAAGRDAFKDFGAVPVRLLAVLYPSYTHLVTLAGNGINRVADLRGKVVSTGAPGAGTTVLAERILGAAGLDPAKDIRAHNLGVAQSVDALKDRKVDAFFWNGGIPTAAILDLVNTAGITARILPLDDVLPELQRRYGQAFYSRTTIPAAV